MITENENNRSSSTWGWKNPNPYGWAPIWSFPLPNYWSPLRGFPFTKNFKKPFLREMSLLSTNNSIPVLNLTICKTYWWAFPLPTSVEVVGRPFRIQNIIFWPLNRINFGFVPLSFLIPTTFSSSSNVLWSRAVCSLWRSNTSITKNWKGSMSPGRFKFRFLTVLNWPVSNWNIPVPTFLTAWASPLIFLPVINQ